ncbi:hypothetical protein DSO57_1000082 [Entomophthora muscae]|uniref:Uncharacterized protein n=1 Tax=Entomophthora muscae TaxID=34485 RepID=A0ACC2SM72_9FUNG|nr:hypothetical protein DSO57_1000082 [Entomophthora muscae]
MKLIGFLPLLWASATFKQDGRNNLEYNESYENSGAVIIRRQNKAVSKKEAAIDKNDKPSEEKKDTNDKEETKTKETSKEPEPEPEEEQEQSEEEDEDDPNQLSNLIKIVEPVYGTLNILNIPLGGEQKNSMGNSLKSRQDQEYFGYCCSSRNRRGGLFVSYCRKI